MANRNVGRDKHKVIFSFPTDRLDPGGDENTEEYKLKVDEVALKVMLDLVKQTKGSDGQLAAGLLFKIKEIIFKNIEEIINVYKKLNRYDDCQFIIGDLIDEAREVDLKLANEITQFIKNKTVLPQEGEL